MAQDATECGYCDPEGWEALAPKGFGQHHPGRKLREQARRLGDLPTGLRLSAERSGSSVSPILANENAGGLDSMCVS